MLMTPSIVVPSNKVMVPVGAAIPSGGVLKVSPTVNVTVWPKTDGDGETVRVSFAGNPYTYCPKTVDTFGPLALLNTARRLCDPAERLDTVMMASPFRTTPVPRSVEPSKI